MPAKNIATTVKTIMASFRGGLSPRICLSKSSQSRCSISESPLPGMLHRNAKKRVPLLSIHHLLRTCRPLGTRLETAAIEPVSTWNLTAMMDGRAIFIFYRELSVSHPHI